MRKFKLISYFIAAVSMNYYRLLNSKAFFTFNENTALENAELPEMIPYEADHLWIPTDSGEEISAWLVVPKGRFLLQDEPFPVVVLAPGFGNQKDMGLLQFAESFAESGVASLLIDYRTFGGSSRNNWDMRNYVNPWRHAEDIVTAVKYIRNNKLGYDNIDIENIALWGAAYGGGHVIMAAHELGPTMIRGVIAQAPFLHGREAAWRTLKSGGVLRLMDFASLAATDVLRKVLGFSPLYIKIISDNKTDISFLTVSPAELKTYFSKHPKKYLGGWENKAPARSFFSLSFYSPMKYVQDLQVPILFIASDMDEISPLRTIMDASNMATHPNSTLAIESGLSHFDFYSGKGFARAVSAAKSFMETQLFEPHINYFRTLGVITKHEP